MIDEFLRKHRTDEFFPGDHRPNCQNEIISSAIFGNVSDCTIN
jgi:hypothetical protein